MDLRFYGLRLSSVVSKTFFLIAMVLIIRTVLRPKSQSPRGFLLQQNQYSVAGVTKMKYLEVPQIVPRGAPTVVYLAVADALVEDGLILNGWREGLVAVEKKKLGVVEIYNKHPYLIQAAIDYEVCSRADVFVGNSYSTFSSLLVLERSAKMAKMGVVTACGIGMDVRWPSYAYNLKAMGESGPRPWMTALSDSSLQAISYGSNNISC